MNRFTLNNLTKTFLMLLTTSIIFGASINSYTITIKNTKDGNIKFGGNRVIFYATIHPDSKNSGPPPFYSLGTLHVSFSPTLHTNGCGIYLKGELNNYDEDTNGIYINPYDFEVYDNEKLANHITRIEVNHSKDGRIDATAYRVKGKSYSTSNQSGATRVLRGGNRAFVILPAPPPVKISHTY